MSYVPENYDFDIGLAHRTYRKYLAGRHNIITRRISATENELLKSTWNEGTFVLTRPDDLGDFTGAFDRLMRGATQAYRKEQIGSWSLGGFRFLCALALIVANEESPSLRFAAMSRCKSQLLTAQILAKEMTIWSLIATFIRWLVDYNLAAHVSKCLDQEKELHAHLASEVQASPSMTEWFLRVDSFSPVTDGIYGVYWSISQMIKQGVINSSKVYTVRGLEADTQRREENRLDELAAYTGSHAMHYYLRAGDVPCCDYIRGLVELAGEEGPRVAKRQAHYDMARLWIPKILMEVACQAVDDPRSVPWFDAGRRSISQERPQSYYLFKTSASLKIGDNIESGSPDNEEARLLAGVGDEIVDTVADCLQRAGMTRGFAISGTDHEKSKILLPTYLSKVELKVAAVRQMVHLMQKEGLLRQSVPVAAAIGYYQLAFMEIRQERSEPRLSEMEEWQAAQMGIAAGRHNYNQRPAETIALMQNVLERYRKSPTQDARSYWWAAVIAGVVLELFPDSEQQGLRYLVQIASGKDHDEAIEFVNDQRNWRGANE